jgi:hypothetical protein
VRNDVNIPSKSNKQKNLVKTIFSWHLEGHLKKEQDPDQLTRILTEMSSESGTLVLIKPKLTELLMVLIKPKLANVISIVDPDPVASITFSMIRIRKKSFWIKIRAPLDPK